MPPIARSLAATAVILPVLLSVGCTDPKAKWRWEGRNAAERDIANGRLCLKTYGLPSPWTARYHEMAHAKYGIEFETVAGCLVDDEVMERATGYNEPMECEIRLRFGRKALEDLQDAAQMEYQQERKVVSEGMP